MSPTSATRCNLIKRKLFPINCFNILNNLINNETQSINTKEPGEQVRLLVMANSSTRAKKFRANAA